jgi:hypothetical protein
VRFILYNHFLFPRSPCICIQLAAAWHPRAQSHVMIVLAGSGYA